MPTRPPRTRALLAILFGTLVVVPMLGSVTLAAEPTVVVEPGDTLSELALKHGVSVEQLVVLNGLADPDRIVEGQRLRLAPEAEPAAPPAAAAAIPATAGTHLVARGENLWRIARAYGTTVEAIVAANGISNPRVIFAGQQLVIYGSEPATSVPEPPPPAPAAVPSHTHLVARGENLWRIARAYGTTVEAIVAGNGIGNPSVIFAGQQLVIPGAEPAVPAAPPLPDATIERMTGRDEVRALIVEQAQRFGVPAAFALAVAWQESGWRQDAVSSAGAIGVMQLLPATGDWVSQAMLGTPVNVHDARSNVEAGVRLLAHYLDRYAGSRELTLAAYLQGQSAADRHGVYPMTRSYISAILSLQAQLGG